LFELLIGCARFDRAPQVDIPFEHQLLVDSRFQPASSAPSLPRPSAALKYLQVIHAGTERRFPLVKAALVLLRVVESYLGVARSMHALAPEILNRLVSENLF